jgi:predicted nucleic acid-binding protein
LGLSSRIVADASPLIVLIKSDLHHLLPNLFDEIIVPDGVWNEVLAGNEGDPACGTLPKLDWVKRSAIPEKNEIVESYDLGRGESEVISAAKAMHATVLIDDAAARRCANEVGVPILGTGALLVLAKRNGLIESFGEAIERVQTSGLWISSEIVEILLSRAGNDAYFPSSTFTKKRPVYDRLLLAISSGVPVPTISPPPTPPSGPMSIT